MKIRLGCLPYLNVKPLVAALEADPWIAERVGETVVAPPAELARRLAAGGLDAAPVSAGSLPTLPGVLALPAACVSSDGPVRSVVLFSDRPLPQLAGVRILHGTDSVASVRLLASLARERHGLDLTLAPDVSGEHLREGFRAPVLLIGDACLRYARISDHAVRLDLGELWRAHAGLPMVFALYAVRERFAAEHPDLVARLAAALARAAEGAPARAEGCVKPCAAAAGLPEGTVADYFGRIRYPFDARAAAGLAEYLTLLAKCGFAPRGFAPRFHGKAMP